MSDVPHTAGNSLTYTRKMKSATQNVTPRTASGAVTRASGARPRRARLMRAQLLRNSTIASGARHHSGLPARCLPFAAPMSELSDVASELFSEHSIDRFRRVQRLWERMLPIHPTPNAQDIRNALVEAHNKFPKAETAGQAFRSAAVAYISEKSGHEFFSSTLEAVSVLAFFAESEIAFGHFLDAVGRSSEFLNGDRGAARKFLEQWKTSRFGLDSEEILNILNNEDEEFADSIISVLHDVESIEGWEEAVLEESA